MRTTWTPVGMVGLMVVLATGGCREPQYHGTWMGEPPVIVGADGVGDQSAVYQRVETQPVIEGSKTTVTRTTVTERQPTVVETPTRPVRVERGAAPPLKVNVVAPATALICEDIPLRFIVTNQSGLDVSDAMVQLKLPPGLRTVDGRTSIDMSAGTIVANETREVMIPVRADRPGRFLSLASVVSTPGARPVEVVESAMVVGKPVLNLAVEASEPGVNSNEVTVTVSVSNSGDVSSLDTMLEGAMSPNTNTIDRAGATARLDRLSWNLGEIAPGERKELRMRVNAFEPGVVTGRLTVTARCAELVEASFRKEVR